MESSLPENNNYLFFHHQRNPVRQYRRVRKEPEELPQALRYFKYANLNPRIAAFLGKQDPKSILKRAKGGKQDGKEVVAGAQPDGDVGLMGGEFRNELSQEVRHLFPDINDSKGGMLGSFGDNPFGNSRLSFNEAEDPQRYQFEETTFAAPNILRELADTLQRFETSFKEYAQRTTLYDPSTGEPVPTEKTRPSMLLPPGIADLLCQEWKDVTADAMYIPRTWQSSSYQAGYKYAPTINSGKQDVTQLLPNDTGIPKVVATGAGSGEKSGPKISSGLKSIVDLLEESRSKAHTKGSNADTRTALDLKKAGKTSVKDIAQNFLGLPVTGLSKNKDWSTKSNVSIAGPPEPYDKLPRYGGNPTLSFNLSSKKAFEEGWIVNAQPEPDLEQSNLLEWATSRLQSVMKQKEEEEEIAKSNGCDKPMMIRNYGDSRRDTLLKLYRKGNESDGRAGAVSAGLLPGRKSGGVPKIPQLSKMDSAEKEKFMVQLPDGSITVYYPKNGEVAVMASAVPDAPDQLYVTCYANNEDRTCLASFTPYGKSCCYHKNGVPGLILTNQGGLLKTENGSVARKWEWPKNGGKLKESVIFHLNKEMYVRVINKSNVTLHFNSNRESIKIPVGAMSSVRSPQSGAESVGVLQSGTKLSSKAATDLQVTPKPGKGEKVKTANKSRKNVGPRKSSKKPYELEELKHALDPPERFEFESQADRELAKLQDKTRNLVDDWMEHYRMSVGISSPVLKRMLDKPQVKSAHRTIQSARERKVSNIEDVEFDDKGTKFQSFRSPSAPPRHMIPGPHAVVLNEHRKKALTSSNVSKKGDSHVRIVNTPTDGADTRIGKEKFSNTMTSAHGSRQRPATLGSKSLQRSSRSIVRTSSSASAAGVSSSSSREKSWTPASECCPVATRNKLLQSENKPGEKTFQCKCSKHRIPSIHDLEFDYYLRIVAPVTQLIVIYVINSLYPDASPYDSMFERLYIEKNRNRTHPCRQSRHDNYRVLRYDLAVAKLGTGRATPLLLGRHNVVPGMTLMYCGGRLLFADHIFNGYGNAKNDFKKQVFRTKQQCILGHFLPDDFRFTPGRGRSGARSAWGGEVGGTGVDGKGTPGMFFSKPTSPAVPGTRSKMGGVRIYSPSAFDTSQSSSDLTTLQPHPARMPASKSFDTSRDFVQFSLSTRMYVLPHTRQKSHSANQSPQGGVSIRQKHNASFPPTRATAHSAVESDGSLRVGHHNTFVRMQRVK
ncbi:unnamed protein product [Clavelina lepadiformis]|uniref:FAM194 C-terminal domain-containing protein n=1 Tax=Clavelina lepadiformis TaxID=159417 RepID=A0ABP0GFQ7_CLALP